jgi:hypothetical protein
MKKKLNKKLLIVIISLIVAIFTFLKVYEKRTFCTSAFSDIVVTVWNRYFIFEKYEGLLPPRNNYIKIRKTKDLHYNVFFKNDNTIMIWSASNREIKTAFDNNVYNVFIYYGFENVSNYYQECQYRDSSAVKEYELYRESYKRKNWLIVDINEIINDSIISTKYRTTPRGTVLRKLRCIYSRNDEMFDR